MQLRNAIKIFHFQDLFFGFHRRFATVGGTCETVDQGGEHVAAQHQANEDVESVITHPTPPQTDKTRIKRTVGFQPVLVG